MAKLCFDIVNWRYCWLVVKHSYIVCIEIKLFLLQVKLFFTICSNTRQMFNLHFTRSIRKVIGYIHTRAKSIKRLPSISVKEDAQIAKILLFTKVNIKLDGDIICFNVIQ